MTRGELCVISPHYRCLVIRNEHNVTFRLRDALRNCPATAAVVDVSARDGLQSLPRTLTLQERVRWIRSLLDAGFPEVEAGSFVSSRAVPQMAGTAKVIEELRPNLDRLWVLVPNARGLEEAVACGARNALCLVSATETHSIANLGRPIARVLDDLQALARRAREAGIRTRAAVSMAWVDPDEGPVSRDRVVAICGRLQQAGFSELTLCDTFGGASPRAVGELLEEVTTFYAPRDLGLHLHDTFGTASSNVLVGLMEGLARFDASLGGLGGCPFAPGSKGNLDTEKLLYLLDSLGVDTGIDREAFGLAKRDCLEMLGVHAGASPKSEL